ncbi:MAG: hypothetical protein SNI70_06060 [Rikenellaceae bacterium]
MRNIINYHQHNDVHKAIEDSLFYDNENKTYMADLYKLLSDTSHILFWYNYTGGGFTEDIHIKWCNIEKSIDESIASLQADNKHSICSAITQCTTLYNSMRKELKETPYYVTINDKRHERVNNPFREMTMGIIEDVINKLTMLMKSMQIDTKPQKEEVEEAVVFHYDYPIEMLETISKVLRCENIPMQLSLANDIIKWYEYRADLKEGVRLAYIHTLLSDSKIRTFYKAFFSEGLTVLKSESTISNIASTKPIDTTSGAELNKIRNKYKL